MGKQPKCILYVAAGLESLTSKITGTELDVFPPMFGVADIERVIVQMAKIQAELMLCQAELCMMRSAFKNADEVDDPYPTSASVRMLTVPSSSSSSRFSRS